MQQCQGQLIEFDKLQQENITVNHLFHWQVSVDVLNDYQAFLDGETILNDDERKFCNCTEKNTFGTYCEYYLDRLTTTTFQMIVENITNENKMSIACYRGPIANRCTNEECFDWRDICNGVYDCEMGEDERVCLALETNTCSDDEYRCENGLCIPISFSFDFVYDCLDRSDESYDEQSRIVSDFVENSRIDSPICPMNPSVVCEEYSCRYREKSCGDGQCLRRSKISTFDFLPGCSNSHTHFVWINVFSYDKSMSPTCWRAMVCAMGLAKELKMKETIVCSNVCSLDQRIMKCDQVISSECPEEPFVFPERRPDIPFPPDVRLKYDRSELELNRKGLPKYICYNGTWCDGSGGKTTEICQTLKEFGISAANTDTYWDFHDILLYFFSIRCHPPPIVEVSVIYRSQKLLIKIGFPMKKFVSATPCGDQNVELTHLLLYFSSFRKDLVLALLHRYR
jgi:hypothetical protein